MDFSAFVAQATQPSQWAWTNITEFTILKWGVIAGAVFFVLNQIFERGIDLVFGGKRRIAKRAAELALQIAKDKAANDLEIAREQAETRRKIAELERQQITVAQATSILSDVNALDRTTQNIPPEMAEKLKEIAESKPVAGGEKRDG